MRLANAIEYSEGNGRIQKNTKSTQQHSTTHFSQILSFEQLKRNHETSQFEWYDK